MDTQPSNQGVETPQSTEEVLKLVIQDLNSFRQDLTNQLGEDVNRLRVEKKQLNEDVSKLRSCLLYTSPSPRDGLLSRMPSSA